MLHVVKILCTNLLFPFQLMEFRTINISNEFGGDNQEVVAGDIRKMVEVGVQVVVKVLEGDQLEEGVAVVVREQCLFYCRMEAVFCNIHFTRFSDWKVALKTDNVALNGLVFRFCRNLVALFINLTALVRHG